MPSETLGRYRIERELGRGSMGRVLLAHDPEIDRRVAIKTVHIFSSLPERERAEARDRFLREVRAAGKLLHPGIVAIFDVGEEEGVPYLAMEYVEGETLDRFCHRDAILPIHQVMALVAGAADALDFAHQAGIVHRDVKPANLLRVGETAVKIMDFGLAKDPHSSLTQDGALLGTPSYMSPEQIRGGEVDGRSDLFSLGVVLYEMLTGTKPFSGKSVSSVLYRIVNEEPRDASVVDERVPGELSSFLKKALAKNPDERYQTGAEFAAALREVGTPLAAGVSVDVAGGSDSATGRGAPPAVSRKRRSSRLPFVLGAALIFIVVAAGAFYLRHRRVESRGAGTAPSPSMWLEARVRTEPPGLPVSYDGRPLEGDVVRFPSDGPRGALTATQACRTAEHQVELADAGGEIVLVTDPVQLDVEIDPGVQDALVRLNGAEVGAVPAVVRVDLCRENEIEVRAEGYYTATALLQAGSSVLEARTTLGSIAMEKIPVGRLLLPETQTPVVFYVDGQRVERDAEGIELPAGEHKVRAVSKRYWVDVTATVELPPGGSASPAFDLPRLAVLAVQAFPSNCKVYLRRPGGSWVYLDTTPVRRRIAAGSYEVRVEFIPTGAVRERTVDLRPGTPDPIRFSFAGSRR